MTLTEIFNLDPPDDEWDLPQIEFVMFEIGSGKLYISSKIAGRVCAVQYLIDDNNIRIEYPFSDVEGKLADFLVKNRSTILEFWECGGSFMLCELVNFVENRFDDSEI